MGRVYSPSTVEAGGISLVPHHREAGAYVLSQLFAVQGESAPLFDSAMIYGSTVDGPGPTIRSDLDVLVIHHKGDDREATARRVLDRIIRATECTYKLTVEPQVHPLGEVGEDEDPMYAEHIVEISRSKPDWRVNDPSKEFERLLLAPGDREGRLFHACAYMWAKAESFDVALDEYGGFANYQVIQRALELASAYGRKVLPATQRPGEILPPISDKPAMRALLENRIAEHFGPAGQAILDDQRWLADKDARYTGVLQETLAERELLAGSPVTTDQVKTRRQKDLIAEYSDWIEDNYLESVRRAERLSRSWAIVLEDELIRTAPRRLHDLERLSSGFYYGINDRS